MTIKNFTSGDIPFLVNYTSYTLPTGQVECNNVSDMVSVDLQANQTPVEVEYYVGAELSYQFSMTIKNLTANATLKISMPFSNTIFTVENSNKQNSIDFTLLPQEIKQLNVQLNKDGLNGSANYDKLQTNLPLTITSIENGVVVVKNPTITVLPPSYLPLEVTVQ
jgi:hypothetical protein